MLTDDISIAEIENETKVDKYIRLALELEDLDITINLHEHGSKRPNKYDIFWKIIDQFFVEKVVDVIITIDKCRHNTIVCLVTAISVNDLLYQIKHEYPSETLMPNKQWLWLQF